jgi:hypothetical protein
MSILSLSAQELSTDARTAWREVGDPLEEILELEDLRETLPESRWVGRDQKDLDRDVSVLLQEVQAALRISGLSKAREGYAELERKESLRRNELREIREKAAVAPADVSALEFYRKDREAFLAEAKAVEKELENLHTLKEELVEEMILAAREAGVVVDAHQMRFLLSSVSGSDLLDLGAVFQNVRELHGMLETLVRDNPGDPEAARRYYGMHVVLLRALIRAHDDVLVRIDDRYLPRLKELENENDKLQEETDELLRFAEEAQRELLRSSRNTQRVTEEALELYKSHLDSVRDRVYETRKELQQRTDVAWNAYRTIRIAAVLAEEMTSAVQDLQTLRSLDLPDLLPLQDAALQQKFMELSEQLKE